MSLQSRIDVLIEQGFELVQEGRIVPTTVEKPTFSDRADCFRISMLGAHVAPTWRSEWDNRLLDDEERWAHLRRRRA